ncbi:MAG: hypothetical protein HQL54_08845, partial [Magnetococcales bacterium]|nr:hypothetical protein [Magnetococcales bacterium]
MVRSFRKWLKRGVALVAGLTLVGSAVSEVGAAVPRIQAGYDFSVGLRSDGAVITWGWNRNSQLGIDDSADYKAVPLIIPDMPGTVEDISAGYYHTLAISDQNSVISWGYDLQGQLGRSGNHLPAVVSGLSDITAVSAGGYHSLALDSSGSVWSWGYNFAGQLGAGDTTDRNRPYKIEGLTGVSAIAAGQYHSLALKSNGTVWAWGYNAQGQVGNGDTSNVLTPVQITGLS